MIVLDVRVNHRRIGPVDWLTRDLQYIHYMGGVGCVLLPIQGDKMVAISDQPGGSGCYHDAWVAYRCMLTRIMHFTLLA